MYNPLAIGVTLGGLLLDVVVPRPKPRAGHPLDPSLLSERTGARTARYGGVGRTQSPAEAKRGAEALSADPHGASGSAAAPLER